MNQPTVVFIGLNPDPDNNFHWALTHYLKSLGCRVLEFVELYDFAKHVKKTPFPYEPFLFVIEHWRQKDAESTIRFIRRKVSEKVIMAVRASDPHETTRESMKMACVQHKRTFRIRGARRLGKVILKLFREQRAPIEFFGAQTADEQRELYANLERTHRISSKNANQLAGITGDTRVLLEALRLRLLPSSEIKGEFDDALEGAPDFPDVPQSVFKSEVARIVNMTDKERIAFTDSLLEMEGCCRVGGGIMRNDISRGFNTRGFAIDALTGTTHTTNERGLHDAAQSILARKLEYLDDFFQARHTQSLEDTEFRRYQGIVKGYLFHPVPGFHCPIFRAHGWLKDPKIKRAAEILLRQEQYIPITPYGHILGTFVPDCHR
ncbi:MAG: hypothetical protein Q7R83_03890 [bacterium]|nr:hypothetical protein [bacterium]